MKNLFGRLALAALTGLGSLVINGAVSAQNVPVSFTSTTQTHKEGWVTLPNATARLVAGSSGLRQTLSSGKKSPGSPTARIAGLHIKLNPKWKTYWRSPGDSGVPPHFDWTGSQNVKSVKILWPAPGRYTDTYSSTVGYKKEVVLPMVVERTDPALGVDLKLKLFFGICDDICVPANALLRQRLPVEGKAGQDTSKDALITYFYRKVPKPIPVGAQIGEKLPLGVRSVTIDRSAKAPKLLIEAVFPAGSKRRDLFAEAGSEIYLPRPKVVSGKSPNKRTTHFFIDLSRSGGAKALTGKKITLTLVSENNSGEASLTAK